MELQKIAGKLSGPISDFRMQSSNSIPNFHMSEALAEGFIVSKRL